MNKVATTYLPGEGRGQLRACMLQTFRACARLGIHKIVIFTATGEGPLVALRRFIPRPEYQDIAIVAVTPPAGRLFPIDPRHPERGAAPVALAAPLRKFLDDSGVPVITPQGFPLSVEGVPSDARTANGAIVRAFGVLGGGFSLGIQAVLIACDAGAVDVGERVLAMTADTSFVAIASNTEGFLSPTVGLLVQEIVCRPATYDISKSKHITTKDALAQRAELSSQLTFDDQEEDD